MLYLLDADTLITGDRRAYPLRRFPIFWEWLLRQGEAGRVKVSQEQYEEVTAGRGDLVNFLEERNTRSALMLAEQVDPEMVADTTLNGYGDLNVNEVD